MFNSRSQKADESFNQLLTALGKLAAKCEFDALNDEMLPDPIVSGFRDLNIANGFFENLRLPSKRLLTFVVPAKWQLVSDTDQSNLVLFTLLAKRRCVVHTRAHEEIRVPRTRAKYGSDNDAVGNCHAYGKTCAKCNKENHLAKVSPPKSSPTFSVRPRSSIGRE